MFQAFIAEIIKFGAIRQDKRALLRMKNATSLIKTDIVKRVPVTAFFNASQVLVNERRLLEKAGFLEIVPVLAFLELDEAGIRAARRGGVIPAGYGQIAFPKGFARLELDFLRIAVGCRQKQKDADTKQHGASPNKGHLIRYMHSFASKKYSKKRVVLGHVEKKNGKSTRPVTTDW